jgi:hypothetical protein
MTFQVTTLAIGEESTTTSTYGEEDPTYTTEAVGEEDPTTSMTIGEEDGGPYYPETQTAFGAY